LLSLFPDFEWGTRVGFAGLTALALVALFFRPFYALMGRLAREGIREASEVGRLAELHASKRNTVTMGGLLMLAAVTPACLVWGTWNIYLLSALGVTLAFGAIGMADDLLKVTKRNKKGLDGKYKLFGQLVISVITLGVLLNSPQSASHIRDLWVPMTEIPLLPGMPVWMTGAWLLLVLMATSNCVNLTDGADGLAIGCSIIALLAFGLMAYLAGIPVFSESINLNRIPGAEELSVLCSAMVGAGLGFLWVNAHPAKLFMGDTGALAIGGAIGMVAFLLNQPLILILVGGVFVLEGASVILQVAFFQTTRKRLFRMAPLHHHFELAGWPETQVVVRFWILSVIFAFTGLWTLFA
jgi:phospho-N-acetylmuramoyl-pentapeptide-transferase